MTEHVENRTLDRPDTTVSLAFEELKLSVEAILFASDRPLEVTEIRDVLGSVSLTDVRLAIKDLGHDFEGRSIEIVELGRKYQLRTRTGFAPTVTKLFSGKPRGLSKSSLETLAIIAYRQPVTRAEINALRQVDSSQVVASLRDRGLIYPSGTRKEVGHPVEYRTTPRFLDVFGLGDLTELPKLRSLQLDIEDEKRIRTALDGLAGGQQNDEQQQRPTADDLAFADSPDLSPADEPMTGEPNADLPAEGPQAALDVAEAASSDELLVDTAEAGPVGLPQSVHDDGPPPSTRPEPVPQRGKGRRILPAQDEDYGLARPVFSGTAGVSEPPGRSHHLPAASSKRAGATTTWTPWISEDEAAVDDQNGRESENTPASQDTAPPTDDETDSSGA